MLATIITPPVAWPTAAGAVPITFRDGFKEPLPGIGRWPQGTTINVVIQKDPDPKRTRDQDIKAGILRWQNELKARGITLNVDVGDITKPPANAVRVEWVMRANLQRGDVGETFPSVSTKTEFPGTFAERTVLDRLTGALIRIPRDVILSSDGQKNAAMHEFGHALGLADEPTKQGQPHNVMDTNVQLRDGAMTFTARDLAEVDTIYGKPQGQKPVGAIDGAVRQLASGIFHYDYLVHWLAGADIPFVQIGTNGMPVTDVMAGAYPVDGTTADAPTPDGWFLFDPRNPASAAGYLDDVDFSPLSTGSALDYLTFVNFTNPLGPSLDSFEFSFDSAAGPGVALAYASGDDQFFAVVGPVPEPRTGLLIALGFIVLSALRRRTRPHPPLSLLHDLQR